MRKRGEPNNQARHYRHGHCDPPRITAVYDEMHLHVSRRSPSAPQYRYESPPGAGRRAWHRSSRTCMYLGLPGLVLMASSACCPPHAPRVLGVFWIPRLCGNSPLSSVPLLATYASSSFLCLKSVRVICVRYYTCIVISSHASCCWWNEGPVLRKGRS